MAFPNALFPRIPLYTKISDEEYSLFHTIDRTLVLTLIYNLGCNPSDAINVVAFLLWLERNMLGSNAVYKVNAEWPGSKISMLAGQVVALLEWLKNPTLVWEMSGDISLIQELCNQNVGFVELHQRRLEILEGKTEIAKEMSRRAFNDEFGDIEDTNVDDHVETGFHGGPFYVAQEQQNQNDSGVGFGDVGDGLVNDPRELINNNLNGVNFGSASGYVNGVQEVRNNVGVEYAAGPVQAPRELQNYNNHDGAGFENRGRVIHDPREFMSIHHGVKYGATGMVYVPREVNSGVEFVAGPVLDPQELQNNVLNGVGFQIIHSFITRQLENMKAGGVAGGSVSEPFPDNGQILPNVPFGPRLRYVETNGRENTRWPIPENELFVLLRGLNVQEEETDVEEDDRTVFLTFSRGYPITEPEVWSFFTRKFGNFIKAIHFEEVPEGVKPLYARMVAQNTSILPLICDVTMRTKYVINGKHVWAKKYVKKNSTFRTFSTSTSRQQNPL